MSYYRNGDYYDNGCGCGCNDGSCYADRHYYHERRSSAKCIRTKRNFKLTLINK